MTETLASGELAAAFESHVRPLAADAEVEAYAALLPLAPTLVLDAAAGVGRLLLPLLARGWHVHGAEGAPARFARLEARLAGEGATASLFRQELSSLNLPFRYGAAYVCAPGPQELPAAKLAAGLARIRAHLVPPGTLVLGFVVPDAADHQPGAAAVEIERVRVSDGVSITLRSEIAVDAEARRIDRRERYERREGRAVTAREDLHRRITWYLEGEAAELVGAAGFRAIGVEALASCAALVGRGFAIVATA